MIHRQGTAARRLDDRRPRWTSSVQLVDVDVIGEPRNDTDAHPPVGELAHCADGLGGPLHCSPGIVELCCCSPDPQQQQQQPRLAHASWLTGMRLSRVDFRVESERIHGEERGRSYSPDLGF